MKIRTGFVSNSSSSSFIMLFDKKPETKSDVLDFLFKNCKQENRYIDQEINDIIDDVLKYNEEKVEVEKRIKDNIKNFYYNLCNEDDQIVLKKFFTEEQWSIIGPILFEISTINDEELYKCYNEASKISIQDFCRRENIPCPDSYSLLTADMRAKYRDDEKARKVYADETHKLVDPLRKKVTEKVDYIKCLAYDYLSSNWKDKYKIILGYSNDSGNSDIEFHNIWENCDTFIVSHH